MDNPIIDLLEKVAKDPMAVADELERRGKEMIELANKIRLAASNNDFISPGGLGDRVKVAVYGPDSKLKQYVEH